MSIIKLIDFAGLDVEFLNPSIKAFNQTFSYERATDATDFLGKELYAKEKYPLTFLINLAQLELFYKVLPKAIKTNSLTVIFAWAEELELYGEFTELLDTHQIFDILHHPIPKSSFRLLLKKISRHFNQENITPSYPDSKSDELNEFKAMHDISIKLSGYTDTDSLFKMVKLLAFEYTQAEHFCMYQVVEREGIGFNKYNYLENKQLQYSLEDAACISSQNNNVKETDDNQRYGLIPITLKNIPGYVTITQKSLLIEDFSHLSNNVPYNDHLLYARHLTFQWETMLTIPMIVRNGSDHTIAVMQLVNKKPGATTTTFTYRDMRIMEHIALHAGISFHAIKLYKNIETLFEGFIRASVKAIESRDPSTSGHSERVATLTVKLARAVSECNHAPFKGVSFSESDLKEIKYAALLHDFGKIGVRESVLIKANKLHPSELSELSARYKMLKKSILLKYSQKKIGLIQRLGKKRASQFIQKLEYDCNNELEEVEEYLKLIFKANQSPKMSTKMFNALKKLTSKVFYFNESEHYAYLTKYEFSQLALNEGTLNPDERSEIERHVSHTFDFLRNIPWTDEFKQVPLIAYAHHERLDGSGYPNRLLGESIPLPSKMMSIADVFDALTTSERPYKQALVVDVALSILDEEARKNKLDKNLVNLFKTNKIYNYI